MPQANPIPIRDSTSMLPVINNVLPDCENAGTNATLRQAWQTAPVSGQFQIYDLYDRESGKHYVGVTNRKLAARISAHASQARRDRRFRPGGLMDRLRQLFGAGRTIASAFTALVVAIANTKDEARALERRWIKTLNSAHPDGYNLLPGGSSLGGPANSKSIEVKLGPKGRRRYPSISEAIADRNALLRAAGKSELLAETIYARLTVGWSASQALGWRQRQDGRSRRAPFEIDGRLYSSIAAASRRTGLSHDTLRSRLHRLTRSSVQDTTPEIGRDRRTSASKGSRLRIVWPVTGEGLTTAQFATRTGVPKATVRHRWHRLHDEAKRRGRGTPTAQEVHDALLTASDRRHVVTLRLPNGTVLNGGERGGDPQGAG